jgi:hypothetical protein
MPPILPTLARRRGDTNIGALHLQANGRPVDNAARNLWVTETALSTALDASYMAESLSLFGIVVGVALLLSGIGFGILAAGGTLKRAEPALQFFGKRTPTDSDPMPFRRRSTRVHAALGTASGGPNAFGKPIVNARIRRDTPVCPAPLLERPASTSRLRPLPGSPSRRSAEFRPKRPPRIWSLAARVVVLCGVTNAFLGREHGHPALEGVDTLPESERVAPVGTDSEPAEQQRISLWRNNEVWSDRLREDRAILQAQLSDAQDKAIRGIVERTDGGRKLEFLVVYGSVSRGEQRANSDLDIYYETRDLAVELERADPESRWHVFGVRSGALMESVRRGDEMAFGIVSDALIVFDDGLFRALVVAVDEEQLKPAEP